MHRIGDGANIALKQSACVGIGDHDPGDIIPELFFKRSKIDAAGFVGGNVFDREATLHRRRRVSAMRRFWREHARAFACFAARFERGFDRHHAAQLAMGTRFRRHRNGGHAGQFFQPEGQIVD